MRVVSVTTYDPKDPSAFGGHNTFWMQEVEKALGSMDYIGPLEHTRIHSWICKAKERFYYRLGKRYTPGRDKLLLKHYAHQIRRELAAIDPDIVFCPMSPASQPMAYVDCKQPIVIWTDSCFSAVVDFYPSYLKSYLCGETYRHGMANEKAALDRCTMAIYSSEWAAQSAIDDHGIDPGKIEILPFGANVKHSYTLDDIDRMISQRPDDTCKLLFLAAAWERKGGDLVLKVAKQLAERGVNVQLAIIGCRPPDDELIPEYVSVTPYIHRSVGDGEERLSNAIAGSHFLIMPTRADCSPTAFPDANSFGVPCLTTDIGGIKTIIRDDVNGKTFSIDAEPDVWCDYIESVFADRPRYEKLARSSFGEYESRLNWDVSVGQLKQLMESLL
jgi:glycosyltransferase involved in cell wall biosynthesis